MPELKTDDQGALVLFSGGQDSTACLAWALARYGRVETVGFDYGQRHAVELKARRVVRRKIARAFPDWAADSVRTTGSISARSARSAKRR